MTMLWLCGLSTLAALLAVSGEESCARGAGATCKGAAKNLKADASGHNRTAKAGPTADIITQEVEELKDFVKLCDERINMLTELKQMVGSGVNLSLPDANMRMLREKVPLMSEVAIAEDKAPTGSADDYLISKVVMPQESPVSFIKFLTLRSHRSGSSSSPGQLAMPSVLLVAVQADGTVRLFTASGELVLTFNLGHEHSVTHLAVSQSQDEYTILTGDAGGVIRVNKINMRQRRLTKDQKKELRNSVDEKQSQYLGAAVNVTAQFLKEMQVPPAEDGEPAKLTSLALATHQGTKYFVSGDVDGKINVFTKNGTFQTRLDASFHQGDKIEALYSHLSNLIFRTTTEWGFVDLGRGEVMRLDCPGFDGRVTAVILDSQQAQRVLVADEDGTVWVLHVKEKRHCKVEHSFPKGATNGRIDLASIKGYTLALEQSEEDGEASVLALNMSHVGKKKEQMAAAPSAVVWRRRQDVRDWSVHKRFQQGDLIALLSEDGLKIEVLELLMAVYTAPAAGGDAFGNFKMPMIGVAILLVLGYQYVRNKGKFGGGGGGNGKKDFSKMDMSAFSRKKGLGGLGGLAGLRKGGGLGGGGRFGKR